MKKSITIKSAFTKRLLKNKGAIFGIVVIIIAFVVAVFAYFIAQDDSPYANRIIPEIANKRPGFAIHLLQVKRDSNQIVHTGFFEKLLMVSRMFILMCLLFHLQKHQIVL